MSDENPAVQIIPDDQQDEVQQTEARLQNLLSQYDQQIAHLNYLLSIDGGFNDDINVLINSISELSAEISTMQVLLNS